MWEILLEIIILFWLFGNVIFFSTLNYKNLDVDDIFFGIIFLPIITFGIATSCLGWYYLITGEENNWPWP